jgi:hypothetical protein
MSDEENAEYEPVMPFVAVASNGGPYDDQAYTAGYEMGVLDEALKWQPPTHSVTIRTDNAGQADLLAMRHGYRCTTTPSEDAQEWTFATFEPVEAE